MAAGTLIQTDNVNFWHEGLPETNLKVQGTMTENLSFWFDGTPYAPAFKASNGNTMMPFFWGI